MAIAESTDGGIPAAEVTSVVLSDGALLDIVDVLKITGGIPRVRC
jgi:hypothetical protein